MSSLKQIEANRLNAAKSTGPRTAAGKSITRLNALKYGLFATDPVIPGEDPAHFDALRTSHFEQFLPATPHEHVLLVAMVRDAWSLERSSSAETSIWTRAMEGNRGQTHPLGRSSRDSGKTLALIQRRIDSAQRNYRRNLELLMKVQAVRQLGSGAPAKPAPAPQMISEPIAQPQSPEPLGLQIGSVPPNTPAAQPNDPPARPRVTFPILGRKTVLEPPPPAV